MRDGLPRAEAESRAIARGEAVNRASGGDGDAGARVVTLGELFDDRTARSLWVLGGAVVVLLLIVCANVANLTLARSMARTRDLAVRAALGASRGALFRVALLEHAIIGVAGAALGLAVAAAAIVGGRRRAARRDDQLQPQRHRPRLAHARIPRRSVRSRRSSRSACRRPSSRRGRRSRPRSAASRARRPDRPPPGDSAPASSSSRSRCPSSSWSAPR